MTEDGKLLANFSPIGLGELALTFDEAAAAAQLAAEAVNLYHAHQHDSLKSKSMRLNHYMNWVEGTRLPGKIHDTLETATAEAERLCRKENKPVHLFKSVAKVSPTPPPVLPLVWEGDHDPST